MKVKVSDEQENFSLTLDLISAFILKDTRSIKMNYYEENRKAWNETFDYHKKIWKDSLEKTVL